MALQFMPRGRRRYLPMATEITPEMPESELNAIVSAYRSEFRDLPLDHPARHAQAELSRRSREKDFERKRGERRALEIKARSSCDVFGPLRQGREHAKALEHLEIERRGVLESISILEKQLDRERKSARERTLKAIHALVEDPTAGYVPPSEIWVEPIEGAIKELRENRLADVDRRIEIEKARIKQSEHDLSRAIEAIERCSLLDLQTMILHAVHRVEAARRSRPADDIVANKFGEHVAYKLYDQSVVVTFIFDPGMSVDYDGLWRGMIEKHCADPGPGSVIVNPEPDPDPQAEPVAAE